MLAELAHNRKLLTAWLQEARPKQVQKDFMVHKYPNQLTKVFNDHVENKEFNRWIKDHQPR